MVYCTGFFNLQSYTSTGKLLEFYFKSKAERVVQALNWAVSIGKDWQWQYDYECNRRDNEN